MKILKSRYHIGELIQEDIFSELFHGIDKQTNTSLLIYKFKKKYLSQSLIKQLMKSAEALIGIEHENIVRLLDYAFDGVEFYAVYEGVESYITLEEYVQHHEWSSATLWRFMTQILSALVVLEQSQLAHGSLSLNTILISKDKKATLIKSNLQALILNHNIQKMDVLDDCLCVAPDFIYNQGLTSQTDMYSFGVILQFLFSKSWPYPYTVSLQDYKASLLKGPKPFKKYEDKIPDRLSEVVRKCLQVSSTDRFDSFIDLIKTYKGDYSIDVTQTDSPAVLSALKVDLDKKKAKKTITRLLYTIGILSVVSMLGMAHYFYSLYITAIPERIVPNVVGLDKQLALEMLQQHHLRGIIAGERIHPLYKEGMVIESKPRAGRDVKQNRLIRLYLSKGKGSELVPDLVGRGKGQAEELLVDRGIHAEVVDEHYSIEYAEGVIISQYPSPNTLILPSENIQLVLSKGFPVSMTISKVKSSFFKNKDHLRQVSVLFSILPEWESQKVTILFSNKGKSERIYSDVHDPQEAIELDFELEVGGDISVYFNEVNAFSQRVMDDPDKL